MRSKTRSTKAATAVGSKAVLVTVVIITSTLGLAGCSKIIKAVKATHNALHQAEAVQAFSDKVKTGDATTYEVTYVTTGHPQATIVYADAPPHDFAFDTTLADKGVRIIVSSRGQYACNRSQTGSSLGPWSCLKLKGSDVDTYRATYALYTGAYWIDFLKIYSTAAGLEGVSITSGSKTVNGFNLQCVDITSTKKNFTPSQWCVTSQGILGYVSMSSSGAAFEIKAYSSSPPSSLFQLPGGATITTIPTGTS
jgi:uncharacterized protein YceK